jgi:hypothetical protein
MSGVHLVIALMLTYCGLGIIFAAAFALRGASALDPVAREAGTGFRLMILPGAAALWPLLLLKRVRGGKAS